MMGFFIFVTLLHFCLLSFVNGGEVTSSIWTTTPSSTRVLATTRLSRGLDIPSKTAEQLFHQHNEKRNKSLADTITNTTATRGDVVFLPCETPQSMGKQVSWVRRKDWHILTSGLHTYTKEERFAVHHPRDSNRWTLAIKYVKLSDAGLYECQIVGGNTAISKLVNLRVVTPKAIIPGKGEYHVDAGSTISLVCHIDEFSKAPQYIFWYHNKRMINYDTERGGISVEIFTEPKVRSVLTISDADLSDSGKYSCNAANTIPADITVYITQVNKIAAVQPRDVDNTSSRATNPTSPFYLTTLLLISLVSASTVLTNNKNLKHLQQINSRSKALVDESSEIQEVTVVEPSVRFKPD